MEDNVLRHCYDGMWGMSADQKGDWVSYEDYKELLDKFNELQRQIDIEFGVDEFLR